MIVNKKIVIGTANFGMSYGLNNPNGKINSSKILSILDYYKSTDLELIDTAISYGNSEEVLGKVGVENFKIITKLPQIPRKCKNVEKWIMDQILTSLKRLNIKSLYGLLLHHPEDLNGPFSHIILKTLYDLKSNGLILKLGVSLYYPKQLKFIIPQMKLNIVQFPLNVIDQRFEVTGCLSDLHKMGVELHARSAFLQGLLLMERNLIPVKFKKWTKIWDKWSNELKIKKLTPLEACLSYPLSLTNVDNVIVGINDLRQLKEIVRASQLKNFDSDWSLMSSNDEMLINPSNWKFL